MHRTPYMMWSSNNNGEKVTTSHKTSNKLRAEDLTRHLARSCWLHLVAVMNLHQIVLSSYISRVGSASLADVCILLYSAAPEYHQFWEKFKKTDDPVSGWIQLISLKEMIFTVDPPLAGRQSELSAHNLHNFHHLLLLLAT